MKGVQFCWKVVGSESRTWTLKSLGHMIRGPHPLRMSRLLTIHPIKMPSRTSHTHDTLFFIDLASLCNTLIALRPSLFSLGPIMKPILISRVLDKPNSSHPLTSKVWMHVILLRPHIINGAFVVPFRVSLWRASYSFQLPCCPTCAFCTEAPSVVTTRLHIQVPTSFSRARRSARHLG